MAIYYDLYRMPQAEGDEKGKQYARVKSIRTLSTDELLQRVIEGTRLAKGEAQLVLDRVVDELKTAIAQGFRVHVDELGYFAPQLEALHSDDRRRKYPEVYASGLSFVPEKDVKLYLRSIETRQAVNAHRAVNSIDEAALDDALRAYLEEKQTVTRRQLQFIYPHISRTALCRYLVRCQEEGKLYNIGTKNAPVYVKGDSLYLPKTKEEE